MVGGLAGERLLHRDPARDAAGTRLPGPVANQRRGRRRGAEGRGARRNHAREAPQETLLAAPLGISPPCLQSSPGQTPRGFRVSGLGILQEVSATFSTSRLLRKPRNFREESGWGGSCPRKEKPPTSREGTKAPHAAPRAPPAPLRGPGRWESAKPRGRVGGSGTAGPLQGAWPSVTSAETAGRAAESGETPAQPWSRPGATRRPAASGRSRREAPEAPGPWPPLLSLGRLAVGAPRVRCLPSSRPPRDVSPTTAPPWPTRWERPLRRDPRRRRTPALPRPLPGRGGPEPSLLRRPLFIQQLLRAGRHCRGNGPRPQAGQCREHRRRGLDPELHCPRPLSLRRRPPGPDLPFSRFTPPRPIIFFWATEQFF
ncbi:translation initiation factor IF-2-like [Cebus imitator]|uniref:translation initiation factor IF-2-like n=1 Tax=Cebus imitator TaxID=2715852 RepID=UPI00189C192F|nr:translation initiation factor IF-2-like [Cebus imitator]